MSEGTAEARYEVVGDRIVGTAVYEDTPRQDTPADESLRSLVQAIDRLDLIVDRLHARMQPYAINVPYAVDPGDPPSAERCEYLNRLDHATSRVTEQADRIAGLIERLQI